MLVVKRTGFRQFITIVLVFNALLLSGAVAADQPQWGELYSRNMISTEVNLPEIFNIQTGVNIKWSASLGNQSYGSPTIADGKVLIGANNQSPRDLRHRGDRGILLCLDEKDGSLCWQLVVPRIEESANRKDIYLDWPNIGLPSAPTIEGGRIYTLTNRFEVVCLDLEGQANGNDGPYVDEGRHMVAAGQPAMEVTPIDADIIWIFDMPKQAGTYPHDAANASILIDGPYIYVNTCNGVDNTHKVIRRPDAPSLIVLDKMTGKLVAKDDENIGLRTFHSNWSSPALGEVNGQRLIFFGGGNGVCYAFEALDPNIAGANTAESNDVKILKRVWSFYCDPRDPNELVHGDYGRTRQGPSTILSMPVFYDNKVYVTFGGDVMQERRTKDLGWLACIDATQTGDITDTGRLWQYELTGRCCSTVSIYDGMIFVADCRGTVHCLDAETGEPFWTHRCDREIWGSTMVVDGKVYVGTRQSRLYIFEASRDKNLISTINLNDMITSTPIPANGVLYVSTMRTLYAVQKSNQQ